MIFEEKDSLCSMNKYILSHGADMYNNTGIKNGYSGGNVLEYKIYNIKKGNGFGYGIACGAGLANGTGTGT